LGDDSVANGLTGRSRVPCINTHKPTTTTINGRAEGRHFPPQKNGGCQKIFFLQVDFRPKVRNLGQKKTILSNENNVTCWKFDASSKKLQLSVCLSFYPKTLLTTIQHVFLSIIN